MSRMQTRAKNATTHPGAVLKGPPRRSTEEVLAQKQSERNEAQAQQDKQDQIIAKIAELEATTLGPSGPAQIASDADDSINKIAAAIANRPTNAVSKKSRKSAKSRRADVNKLNIKAADKNSAAMPIVGSVAPAANSASAAAVSTPQGSQGSKRRAESEVESVPALASKRNKKAKTLVPTGVSSTWAEGLTPASLADARRDIKNAKLRTAGRLSTPRTTTPKTSISYPASTPSPRLQTPTPPSIAAMPVSPTSSELDRDYPLLPVVKTKPFHYHRFDRATIEALSILAQQHGDALALQIEPGAVPDVLEAQPEPDLEEPGSVNYGGYISDNDDNDEAERGAMSDSDGEDIKMPMDGQRTTENTMVGIIVSDENPPAPAPSPVTRTTRTSTSSGKSKFTLSDLPGDVDHHTFKNVYIARLVAYIGVSIDPWVVKHNPDWSKIYSIFWTSSFPGTPLPTFAPGHAVWELSRQWVCTWRHNLAKSAIQSIEEIADAKGFAVIPSVLPEVQEVQASNRAEFIKALVAEGLGPHRPFQSIAIRISPDQNKA
ncbi:hypothetical protein EUX98_g9538, partial [Antrodiella citrinella]